MNLAEMRTEVRERIGERTENFWKDTFIDRHLKDGVRQFVNEERWHWRYATQKNIPVAAGQSDIELIDHVDFSSHFGLVLTKDSDSTGRLYLPRRVSPANGLRLRRDYTTASTPEWYYLSRAKKNTYEDGEDATALVVTLVPTPDEAFTAEYTFMATDIGLKDDTDEPELPLPYHMAPVAWATAQCFLKESNGGTKAQEQFNLYNAMLEKAMQDHKELAADEIIGWGREEPEFRGRSWYDDHIQGPVGL